jgi:hypothetical protein
MRTVACRDEYSTAWCSAPFIGSLSASIVRGRGVAVGAGVAVAVGEGVAVGLAVEDAVWVGVRVSVMTSDLL